jgi:hypothetical protein
MYLIYMDNFVCALVRHGRQASANSLFTGYAQCYPQAGRRRKKGFSATPLTPWI